MSEIRGKLFREDEESYSPLDRVKMDPETRKVLDEVISKIKYTDETTKEIAKEHERIDWEWKRFLGSKRNRPKPIEDWIRYSCAFYSDMQRAFEKRTIPKGYGRLHEKEKSYSAIVGNWLLNNHLLYYNKLTRVVPTVIVLESLDSRLLNLIVKTTYTILRKAACSVHTTRDGNPLTYYPFRIENEYPVRYSTPRDFINSWERKFTFLHLSDLVREREWVEFMESVGRSGNEYFTRRFPLIIATTYSNSPIEKTNCVIRYRLEEDY
jgi:hypothetical protein